MDVPKEEKYRKLQGTYPVICLSFAGIKENTYQKTYEKMCQVLSRLYIKFDFIKNREKLTDSERMFFERMEECKVQETEAVGFRRRG